MSLISIAVVHIANRRALLVVCLIYLGSVNPFLLTLYASQWPFSGIAPLGDAALAAALEGIIRIEDNYKKW